jgi:hypothetical protein
MEVKEGKEKLTSWIASEDNGITGRAMVSTKRKTKQQLALDCTPRHAHLRCTKTAGDRDQSGDQLLTPRRSSSTPDLK